MMKKCLIGLILITFSLTACSTKNTSNVSVKESSKVQLESTVEDIDIDFTELETELELESELETELETDLEIELESELDLESELETELDLESNLKAGIIYIGDSRIDLNSWEKKSIYEIIDEISSANLKFTNITGTITHDVEFLDNGIPVNDVKLALNDMKSKLIEIRFGDISDNFGTYKLSLHKKTDEKYSLSLEVRFTDNFYIGDSKKSVTDLRVMEKDINFEELSKNEDLFDGYIIMSDISVLESGTMKKDIQLDSNGTYTYSLYKYNPKLEKNNETQESKYNF